MANRILKQICKKNFKQRLGTLSVVRNLSVKNAETQDHRSGQNAGSDKPLESGNFKTLSEMPGPLSLPFIGCLYKFLPLGGYSIGRLDLADKIRFKKYGSIVHEEITPGRSLVYLYDPDDIATMFGAEGKYPQRLELSGFKKYREDRNQGPGLPNLKGEAWKKYRSLVQKDMMRPSSTSEYLPAQAKVVEDFVDRMVDIRDQNGEIDDFLYELYKWAMESIGIVCFDRRVGTLEMNLHEDSEVNKFIRAVGDFFDGLYLTIFFWNWYERRPHSKAMKKFYKAMDDIWEIGMSHVDNAIKRALNKEISLIPPEKSILLGLLAKKDVNLEDALPLIIDIFVGGVDTTAHMLAYNLYNLAMNPHCQKTLQEEIDTLLPSGTEVTDQLLNKMKYLKAVTKESSRLTPVVLGHGRILDHDIVLSGYKVPAGVPLITGQALICSLEKYFDKPEEFIPERWLRDSKNKATNINPYALLPFGHGPRMCIGKRFAEQEVWIALIKIFQRFKVEYHHEAIGFVTRTITKPDKPLRLSFKDRC